MWYKMYLQNFTFSQYFLYHHHLVWIDIIECFRRCVAKSVIEKEIKKSNQTYQYDQLTVVLLLRNDIWRIFF